MKLSRRLSAILLAALALASILPFSAAAQNCDHANAAWVVTVEASCSAVGTKELQCPDCLETLDSAEIPKKWHNYAEWVIINPGSQGFMFNRPEEGSRQHTCTVCGYAETESFDPGKETWSFSDFFIFISAFFLSVIVGIPVNIFRAIFG